MTNDTRHAGQEAAEASMKARPSFPKIMGPSDKRESSPSSTPAVRKNARHLTEYGNAVEGRGPVETGIECWNATTAGGPLPIKIAPQERHESRGVDDFLKPRGKKGNGGRG